MLALARREASRYPGKKHVCKQCMNISYNMGYKESNCNILHFVFQSHSKTTYLAHLFDAVHGMALELSELARKEIITSKSDIIDMRKALYDKLKRANKKAAGFPSSIGGVDTMFFDKKHTGPPAFEVVNLVVGVTPYIFATPGNRPVSTDYTARNAQVAASVPQACHLAVIKSISGCVHIACSGLMITSLLEVVKRPAAS